MLIKYVNKNLSEDKRVMIIRANEIIEEYRDAGFTLSLRQLYYLIEGKLAEFIDRALWDEVLAEEEERREILSQLHGRFDELRDYLLNNPL